MIKKTLCFSNPAYLSLKMNQLMIRIPNTLDLYGNKSNELDTSISIEDIGIVVLDNKQITITQGVIEKLLANNCALITCDDSHLPVGMMLPLSGNTTQNERFRNQIESSLPLKKQLWQQTIQAKIYNQAKVLKLIKGIDARNMFAWINNVKSGDSENLEGRAAAYYWKTLFSNVDNFTRERDGVFPNSLLNYGYAILRAVVARALVISGLLPTLGIHHHNRYNAYCLADDIMEPYRPYVDILVCELMSENSSIQIVDAEVKKKLLSIPTTEVIINGKRSPLMVAVSQTTASLYRCFSGEQRKLVYPEIQ